MSSSSDGGREMRWPAYTNDWTEDSPISRAFVFVVFEFVTIIVQKCRVDKDFIDKKN